MKKDTVLKLAKIAGAIQMIENVLTGQRKLCAQLEAQLNRLQEQRENLEGGN
ncbi:hypothetical protein SAMN02745119_03208 [Trichlorobacter thiogenes]|uniref:Uncharacterized protein n=1 Tax=Trichlorobacter thiogenes TaxID=115783 RepID=A0A1T4S3Z5_9BACT|nr:hypothetical protein [Trichlorobacter thiogenes]SKA22541.1 hypothetical protein SAMN02745119_03208 [Trichlorobacter thiogenes]